MDISTHVTIPSRGNFLLYLHATILYTMVYKSLTRLDVLDDTEQNGCHVQWFLIFPTEHFKQSLAI